MRWTKNKDIQNPVTKKKWQIIKKRVFETLYLFENLSTAFTELYISDQLPFDTLGKVCVSALRNPADDEGIASIVDILAQYSQFTRDVLLASISLCSIYQMRRKTPPFRAGDIRRVRR